MADLDTALQAAFAGGLEEITIRVSRYGTDGKPAAFQAIAKRRNAAKGPWGVGVLGKPIAAALRALRALTELEAKDKASPDEDAFG